MESLNTLKPADITVVKSMKNPPQAIKLVMAAVCVMLEIKPEKMKNSSGKTVRGTPAWLGLRWGCCFFVFFFCVFFGVFFCFISSV